MKMKNQIIPTFAGAIVLIAVSSSLAISGPDKYALKVPNGLTFSDPVRGAYFQVVDYSAISAMDDLNFAEWLIHEAGVAAIPVSAFYETPPDTRLVRFCFAKSDETLRAAAERLCRL